MFVSEDLTVNEKNHLVIGKNDTVELAKEFVNNTLKSR